jgi:histidinol-phosphatase (PHP family)
MVQSAIDRNFDQLGFSSHTMFPGKTNWHMCPENYFTYILLVKKLAKKHKGVIDIFCGLEADYIPGFTVPSYKTYELFDIDFMIGSVHYIYFDKGKRFTIDGPVDEVAQGLNEVFAGDGKKYVQTYFELQKQMAKNFDFDIIAHPDLVRKRNDVLHFFNENDGWYKRELEDAAKVFAQSGKIVEINTGGMARDDLKDAYPSDDFLRLLYKYDVPIMINSDSHSFETLDFAFDFAKTKAQNIGYDKFMCF